MTALVCIGHRRSLPGGPARTSRELSTLVGDGLGTAFIVRSSGDVEIRLRDLPRRIPCAVACLARRESRHGSGRLAVLMEGGHRQTDVSLSRRQRIAAAHTTQTEEHLDSAQPATSGGHGNRRPDDRRRTSRRRCCEGQRLVDDPRSRRGSPGTRRPRRSTRRQPVDTSRMGQVPHDCPQGDAVVGHRALPRHRRRLERRWNH
jgi:hypothetical protein